MANKTLPSSSQSAQTETCKYENNNESPPRPWWKKYVGMDNSWIEDGSDLAFLKTEVSSPPTDADWEFLRNECGVERPIAKRDYSLATWRLTNPKQPPLVSSSKPKKPRKPYSRHKKSTKTKAEIAFDRDQRRKLAKVCNDLDAFTSDEEMRDLAMNIPPHLRDL